MVSFIDLTKYDGSEPQAVSAHQWTTLTCWGKIIPMSGVGWGGVLVESASWGVTCGKKNDVLEHRVNFFEKIYEAGILKG